MRSHRGARFFVVGMFASAVIAACGDGPNQAGMGPSSVDGSGPGTSGFGPRGPQPVFGLTITQAVPPPPISGGHLLITRDGRSAVVADPDRDAVYVVDLVAKSLRATIALEAGAEPGRLVEDGAQRVHVAMRRSGDLVTIDLATSTVLARRASCAAPRGVAYDPASCSVLSH